MTTASTKTRLAIAALSACIVAGVAASFVLAVAYLHTFDGAPPAPQSYLSAPSLADWQVVVHSRERSTWTSLDPMQAHHGPNCETPDHTHHLSDPAQAVFQCRDHVMTALRADEYGVIYLAPPAQVDFSSGEAVVRFDMSTFRSSARDWVDLWITPLEDYLTLPLEEGLPDLQGPPRRAIQIRMDQSGGRTFFRLHMVRDFQMQQIMARTWSGYEDVLTPDKARRDTFELRISRTHITFGMPAYGLWWHDTSIPDLGWSTGVVQFGHHSYSPTKDCGDFAACTANTWHWDNVSINPAVPLGITRSTQRAADPASPTLTFPAHAGGTLHFAASGAPEMSLDGGATWQRPQVAGRVTHDYLFVNYRVPIPAGSTRVQFRGATGWFVNAAHVLADGTVSAPTLTPVPTTTATATPAATSTSTPAPTSPPTSTATPEPTATATPEPNDCPRWLPNGRLHPNCRTEGP
jgi:hypothetical protein